MINQRSVTLVFTALYIMYKTVYNAIHGEKEAY